MVKLISPSTITVGVLPHSGIFDVCLSAELSINILCLMFKVRYGIWDDPLPLCKTWCPRWTGPLLVSPLLQVFVYIDTIAKKSTYSFLCLWIHPSRAISSSAFKITYLGLFPCSEYPQYFVKFSLSEIILIYQTVINWLLVVFSLLK